MRALFCCWRIIDCIADLSDSYMYTCKKWCVSLWNSLWFIWSEESMPKVIIIVFPGWPIMVTNNNIDRLTWLERNVQHRSEKFMTVDEKWTNHEKWTALLRGMDISLLEKCTDYWTRNLHFFEQSTSCICNIYNTPVIDSIPRCIITEHYFFWFLTRGRLLICKR